MNLDGWEIVKTPSCTYIGKVLGGDAAMDDLFVMKPCFEYHSTLVPQQVGPREYAHVRMKVVQAIESGSSCPAVIVKNWDSRIELRELDEDDRHQLEGLISKADVMRSKIHARIAAVPVPAILRPG